jgi:hypothetical protein
MMVAIVAAREIPVCAALPGLLWHWTKRSVRIESDRATSRRIDRIVAHLGSHR